MFFHILKQALKDFRDDTRGSIMVESVITLPILFWGLAATYEFFEVHRYRAVRNEKATFTVSDMFSREQTDVNDAYLDNTLQLFNLMTSDDGTNQIRVSLLRYTVEDSNEPDQGEYSLSWSETRGAGSLAPFVDESVSALQDTLPTIANGDNLILVESVSDYNPIFTVGLSDMVITTRAFTTLRFLPTLCYEGKDTCADSETPSS